MGTYSISYNIDNLSINPGAGQAKAIYRKLVILDTGVTMPQMPVTVDISSETYQRLFGMPIKINDGGVDTTIGDLLSYLTAAAARQEIPEFPIDPIQVEKYGDLADQLLGGE
jgi:hypothetical protein